VGVTGPLDGVTFDFWETLCTAPGVALAEERGRLLHDAVTRAGGIVDAEVVTHALKAAWELYEHHWHANTAQVTGADAAAVVADRLVELEPAIGDVRDVVVETFVRATEEVELALVPGVADVLAALADRGLALGIVCDVGFTPSWRLREELTRHGVLIRFHHWSFSDEVGVFKPDPRIFEHALAGLGGIEPSRAAHIGDIRRTDVAGARGMGMRSVRFAGSHDDQDPARPDADAVIHDYADLLAALGL
jgi:FMN phosphatase YigB (HAD superfamily)